MSLFNAIPLVDEPEAYDSSDEGSTSSEGSVFDVPRYLAPFEPYNPPYRVGRTGFIHPLIRRESIRATRIEDYTERRSKFTIVFKPTCLKITNAASVFSGIECELILLFRKVKGIQVASVHPHQQILSFLEVELADPQVKSSLIILNFMAFTASDKLTTYNALMALEEFLRNYYQVNLVKVEVNILLNGFGMRKYTPGVSQLKVLRELLFGILGPPHANY
ncbi:uncharacterized protein CANTADRAFT_21784 [Suhomyces tanzawaensis NRRL Y-17324]|uniref:Uncharacterized protein n=1 Tax=Suhomyces tanzawaensis NRRL Y-17324 TaxID=984487 RepID=A0A1E4SHP2_9ASCO|nr:uncharacterized protein CANTADRAFT_21784 [Suhomyces tanzawaensis NRRL Y-17324]ODV79005.1 hypothetical protein CANTADRAFT_21784 [Suhomyces tanzawaensis NRRL Y-17324]